MLIVCTNRGCLKSSDAQLNTATNEVVCVECGRVIDNISESMKRALKNFGQILRSNVKKAFMMGCAKCHANREVVLNDANETVCKICQSPIKVTPAFRLAMEENGVKLEKLTKKD